MESKMATEDNEGCIKSPFENYLIVKKLAEISEPAERLKLRQINKFFDSVATEVISSYGSPGVRLFDKNSHINSFVKRMKNKDRYKTQIPFTVFNINLTSISLSAIKRFSNAIEKLTFLYLIESIPPGETLTLDDIPQILEKFAILLSKGSALISMETWIPNGYLFGSSRDLLPYSFPNLKTVSFCCWISLPNISSTLFSEILKRSPNLDHIYLNCNPCRRSQGLVAQQPEDLSTFEYLPWILFDCCRAPPKLDFKAESRLRPRDLPVLTKLVENGYDKMELLDMSFPTYLTFREPPFFQQLPILELTEVVTALNRLLALQYNSLKVLKLTVSSIGQWDRSMQVILPKLNRLEKLKISCCNYLQREVQRRLRPLSAFQNGQFPRLKSMKFFTQRYELGLFDHIPVFSTVEFVSFSIFNTPIERIPLGMVFPNLKRLEFQVFPPIEMVEDIVSNLVHLEDLNFGTHPTEFLSASQRDAIWNCYTGGAKPLNRKHWTQFFDQKEPKPENPEEATTSKVNDTGAGDTQQSKSLGNLNNLKRLIAPIECSQEFHAILYVMATGKLSSLTEFIHNTEPPEYVIRTQKHPMKWDGENLKFINSVQRVLTFA